MKYLRRLVFCVSLLVLACEINAYGSILLLGEGFIDFDGTGDFILQRFPNLIIDRYRVNCTPPPDPGFIVLCREPLDMSLLGNDIVRAEHLKIMMTIHAFRSGMSFRFRCSTCSTPISVQEEDWVGGIVWRLSDQKAQAVQALIDQHGAGSVFMSMSMNEGPIRVFSTVQAVAMDLKPRDGSNTLNPRSRGVIPVAILTTEEFDATSIDVTSLRFGATGEEATAERTALDDVDGDGDIDLLAFFRTTDTGIDCDTLFTYISGVTTTGVSIAGTDSITTVGCH
ncbi:MAG TPA: hypothetical protein VFZ22_19755 [Pyrinomonadaceae bacterium]|nr:hypothetical protein [Pyrinomonadaceae bacterium]